MVIYIFLKFGMMKIFETLHNVLDVKMEVLHVKTFEEINILPILMFITKIVDASFEDVKERFQHVKEIE